MRALLSLCLIILCASSAHAQESSFQFTLIEGGPSLSLPLARVRQVTSFGIGFDVKISGPLEVIDENLYVGGRFMYDALIGKKETVFGFEGETVHNFGLMASAEYTYDDMIVVEANLGIGITANRFNTLGLARSGFIGYKIPDLERPIKVGLFLSRITLSTLHFGVKGTIQLN